VVVLRGIGVVPLGVPDEKDRPDDSFLFHHRQCPVDRVPRNMCMLPCDLTVDGIRSSKKRKFSCVEISDPPRAIGSPIS
jgi:hypothetical protein